MHANERKNNLVPCRHTNCPFISPKPRITFKHTDGMHPRGLKPAQTRSISRKVIANILPQPPGAITFLENKRKYEAVEKYKCCQVFTGF